MNSGQTMHYETDKCGCVYTVGGGDFVGDPNDRKLSMPCGDHERRSKYDRRVVQAIADTGDAPQIQFDFRSTKRRQE